MANIVSKESNVLLISVDNCGETKLTDLQYGFNGCINLVTVPNDIYWTKPIPNMSYMFHNDILFNANINAWHTGSVTNMSYMFNNAIGYNQPLNLWDTSSVTNMDSMFSSATYFNQDLSSWNTSSVSSMNSMFKNDTTFDQDISSWDISNVTDMTDMLVGTLFNTVNYNLLLNAWALLPVQTDVPFSVGALPYSNSGAAARQILKDVDHRWIITDGGFPLVATWSLTDDLNITLPLPSYGTYDFIVDWGDTTTSSITAYNDVDITHTYSTSGTKIISINGTMSAWSFNNGGDCLKFISIDSGGDTGFTSLYGAFAGCNNLISLPNDVYWTRNVTDMSYMFSKNTTFNQPLNLWNTSNVTDMSSMFSSATSFQQDLSSWNVSNVTNMSHMFENTIYNYNLYWNVSNVTNMSYMFNNTNYNTGSLSNWNVSNVTNMSHMFNTNATYFNWTPNLWDTSSVTNMDSMFSNTPYFNKDISSWDTSSVSSMNSMFENAAMFDVDHSQDISSWDISNVTDMTNMLAGTLFYRTNYELLLNAWSLLPVQTGVTFNAGQAQYSNMYASARDILTVDNSWNITDGGLYLILWELSNPNPYGTEQNDYFGSSISISNTYSIVGAYNEDDVGGSDSGKAYIYDNLTGALLWTLDNPNAYGTSFNDNFGFSVGITDTYAIVGARYEDDAGGSDSGKAYIFNPSTGALLHTLDDPNAYGTPGSDQFGISVAITDTYAIVGANYEDALGGTNSGKAYIYDNLTGALLWTLDDPNDYGTSAYDTFGGSVAISESYSIVGAHLEDDASGTESGKAYIFDNSTGNLLWTLDNPNPYSTSTDDQFGFSVGITDTHAVVGAPLEDDVGKVYKGRAYIYDTVTGDLLWTLDNPNAGDPAWDYFGYSVDIYGIYAIIGSHGVEGTYSEQYGKAYIYNVITGLLIHTIGNDNGGDNYFFGKTVSIADNYAVVGEPGKDTGGGYNSGGAYILYNHKLV